MWAPLVGPAVVELARRLPGHHVVLNETVDGMFPAHHPDPTMPENLTDLINSVIDMRYDLGIAFDGDGDRIGAVDGKNGSLGRSALVICKGTPRAQAGCGCDRGCESQPSAR